ncbi:hypothetical protein PPERSA_10407 [Pseudocohnilembus persalinus]|uniref:Uncharacterized protein n=1 Tax=Pseudocohnilembus persalinus TaxID=266149 RepID=A0A0V0QXF2_PSEPJ|nr:hypothetical protein PPERSA_10407 [Pseudocohnilembus persalinus]|eukprot:KRX06549.1 hypothetical protein PPERSA_10407 [Pseudocohnilembus persalinus]
MEKQQKNLKNQQLLDKILNFIQQQNQIHTLKFLYIVDTGLRANNLNFNEKQLNSQQFQFKGLYVGTEDDYLSVIKPPSQIKATQEQKQQIISQLEENQEKFINFDYEFIDIRYFLQAKIQSSNNSKDLRNLWFSPSSQIYLNDLPENLMNTQKSGTFNKLPFPIVALWGKIKQIESIYPSKQKQEKQKPKKNQKEPKNLLISDFLQNINCYLQYVLHEFQTLDINSNLFDNQYLISKIKENIQLQKQKQDPNENKKNLENLENSQNLIQFLIEKQESQQSENLQPEEIIEKQEYNDFLAHVSYLISQKAKAPNQPEIQEEIADKIFLQLMKQDAN